MRTLIVYKDVAIPSSQFKDITSPAICC